MRFYNTEHIVAKGRGGKRLGNEQAHDKAERKQSNHVKDSLIQTTFVFENKSTAI